MITQSSNNRYVVEDPAPLFFEWFDLTPQDIIKQLYHTLKVSSLTENKPSAYKNDAKNLFNKNIHFIIVSFNTTLKKTVVTCIV